MCAQALSIAASVQCTLGRPARLELGMLVEELSPISATAGKPRNFPKSPTQRQMAFSETGWMCVCFVLVVVASFSCQRRQLHLALKLVNDGRRNCHWLLQGFVKEHTNLAHEVFLQRQYV